MTEQADQRRRDAEVSRQIFGAVVEQCDDGALIASIDPDAEETWIKLPPYSVDANFALQVVQVLADRGIELDRIVYDKHGKKWTVMFRLPDSTCQSASSELFAEALCEAGLGALSAVNGQIDKPPRLDAWLRGEVDTDAQLAVAHQNK